MARTGRTRAWISAALTVVACTGSAPRIEGFPLTTSVLDALRDDRPYQLRLDESHRHLSCTPGDTTALIPSASCIAPSPTALRALAELAPRIAEAVRSSPSTDALWAAALLDLSSGNPDARQIDRAISRLVEVRARDSTLVAAANHLAIARLARATVRGDARELYAALDEIEQAWERDSASRAIAFNRVVIHSVLATNRVARAEWSDYLQAESDRSWRAEASERLARLPSARPAVSIVLSPDGIRRDPQLAREFLLDSLLPVWARASLARDTAAARAAVDRARTIGAELLALSGDSSAWRLARSIDSAPPGRAGGVAQLVRGTLAYRATAFGNARDTLASAVQRLEASGSEPLADWARLMLGASHMAQKQHDVAARVLGAVAARAKLRGDRALEARSLWAGAIAVGRTGPLDDAERMFRRSHELFASIGEHRNAATMLTGVADVQGATGRSLEAANLAFQANVATVRAGGAVRYEDLLVIAQQMGDQGYHRASAHLLHEAVLAGHRPKDVPESLGRLSLAQLAMGRRDLATSTIARAREGATHVDDSAMRSRLDAELHRAESQIVAATDPARAMMLVDSARRYFSAIPMDDGPLQLWRAQLALRTGDSAGAQRDLAAAIRTMRGLAPTIESGQGRQLVAALRDAHRTLIDLALARGDTAGAFAETISLPSIGPREPIGAPSVRPVAPGQAELRFVTMPGRVLSWIRVGENRSLAQWVMTREELTVIVARFINLVRSGENTAHVQLLGNQLYRALLAAHESSLAGITSIDVYTDGVLADLPLAVLTDDHERLIVERFAIRHMVSAGPRQSPVAAKTVSRGPLLIGNPAWRHSDFPGLEPLRWADEEVRQIASLYPRHTVLSGDGATKQALLAAMPKHDVIHFAGHSRIVVEDPTKSHMVLATGKSFGDGVLYASEIAKLDLRGVKLVVLSSCGRTREDARGMGEVNGLVLAFLDAGVEAVVAGLWEAEDEGLWQLMKRVHDSPRAHESSGARLRAAQLGSLRVARGSGLGSASGFVVYLPAGSPAR